MTQFQIADVEGFLIGTRLIQVMDGLGFTNEVKRDLIEHPEMLQHFLGLYRTMRGYVPPEAPAFEVLNTSLDELELSIRTINSLRNAGIRKVFQLCQLDREGFFAVRNFGRQSIQEIFDFLTKNRLNLSMKFEMRDGAPVTVADPGVPLVLH